MEKQEMELGNVPITGNFDIKMSAPDGAELRMSGYLYAGEEIDSVNERVDLCREALLRQRRKLEVPAIQKALEANESFLDDLRAGYAGLLEKKTGGARMTSQEIAQMSNLPKQIKDVETKNKAGREAIAKAESQD